jgi:alkylation response protein AidB-like acyl-CoA dehydrogenase
MDFRLTEDQIALRAGIRRFLKEHLPSERPLEDAWMVGFSREFSRALGEAGWIGLTWPRRYGGRERSYVDRTIVTEELLRHSAPVCAHWFGDRQVGPALLAYGSEELREEFLPRIVRGEVVFCLGMSEPNAGSDLASLRTRAVEDGNDFVLHGQKIWTTFAHLADWCYLVARTDPQAPKHKGISEFLVNMRSPGVSVRPIRDLTGEHHFNEIHLEGVRVPRRYLVGEKNRGWYQIASQLDYERSGIERALSNWALFRDVVELARREGRTRSPLVRDRIARLRIEIEIGRWLVYRVAWLLDRGVRPTWQAALAKTFGTEVEQRVAELAGEILGPYSVIAAGARAGKLGGRVARALLFAPAYTIQGGTSNVLRNIVALRALGLPAGG